MLPGSLRESLSVYAQSRSCVHILDIKSSMFTVGLGLLTSVHLAFLFVILGDTISTFSWCPEWPLTLGRHLCSLVPVWQHETMISSTHSGQFTAEYDKTEMRVNTSNYDSLSLSKRRLFHSGRGQNSCFKESSGVLWIWVTKVARYTAVMQTFYCILVVERAKFRIDTEHSMKPEALRWIREDLRADAAETAPPSQSISTWGCAGWSCCSIDCLGFCAYTTLPCL